MSTRLFTSWVRRGAAGAIQEPDPISGAYPGPATFQPSITLARDGAAQPAITGPQLTLLGPGAVLGMSSKAVVRTDPSHSAKGVEDNYLVQIELSRPDLPWMFTPARPNDANRIRPWMVLIVVDASTVEVQAGNPLSRITVNDTKLPDLNDSWAWAHVQVTVDDPGTAADKLDPASGGSAVSRLLYPIRLAPDTDYLACVVPSTLVGIQAGLGQPLDPGPAIAMGWTAGAGQDVILPIYYSWRFSTGDDGDFKSLVLRLKGVRPTDIAGFGTRTVDMSAPWQSPPEIGAGATIQLDGALGTGVDVPVDPGLQAAFQPRLTKLLNFPADLQPATSGGDPSLSAVAPPIYASRHAGVTRVPTDPGWLQTLNIDPRRRIIAAFGTRYVQENQEFLMDQAWDQLGAVQEANRIQALAELAAEVADRLHQRHIQTLGPSELFSMAAPTRTRVLVGSAGTLQASVAVTPLPAGAMTVAFNRFSRPLGPVGRRAFDATSTTIIEKGLAGTVQAAPPPIRLDGLTALVTAPKAAQVTTDATGSMILRGWQSLTTVESAIPPPGNLTTLRQVINTAVKPVTGLGLATGLPILIAFRPPPVAVTPPSLADLLTAALKPSAGILKRFGGRVQIPITLGGGAKPARVMACPQFTAPLAMAILKNHKDWLLPGLGNFPDDRVTVLFTNGEFMEAFMAGVNHEMNRELLWREYPTDQRGTPFQYFWPRPDRNPDIPPITDWNLATGLGQNAANNGLDVENMVVLLVRGEILHRYPRTIVYAAPGMISGNELTLNTNVAWTAPQFLIKLDGRTTAFAFPFNRDAIRSDLPNGKAGFYFVFSEPITGPRFRFADTPTVPLEHWSDLDWATVPQARGFAVAGSPLAPPSLETGPGAPRWNNDAADTARIAFARPFRVGYHADELLADV
jgi:hypothetical protein